MPLAPDRFLVAGLIAGGFTLIVFASAGQEYLYGTMYYGREVGFWKAMLWPGIYWYAWALLTPLVFALAKRYGLASGRRGRDLGMLVLGWGGVMLLHVALQLLAMALPRYHDSHPDFADALSYHFFGSIYTNVITFALLIGAWHAGHYYHTLRRREVQNAHLESQLTRAELESLKMQIHPHFLFNTLNGISELMHRDVDAAERMLSHLSDLLRTSIDRSGDRFVTLDEELSFIENYLAIERTRFADRLSVRFEIADAARDALVPGFVLQPFVENAVKHGVARHARQVTVSVGATTAGGRLRLEVSDDGPGLSKTPVPGIGITNVSRRLEVLFGDDFELRLGNAEPGFAVTIEIPLLREKEPVPA